MMWIRAEVWQLLLIVALSENADVAVSQNGLCHGISSK